MAVLAMILILNLGVGQNLEVRSGEVLNVLIAGEGPAVVLLPGLSGCAYGFRNVTGPLQENGLRTVIIEPLGYGASGRPRQADYSLTAQAERIAAVLETLELRECLVVGHGLAASIALRLAYRRPDLVAAVVSIEGSAAEEAATPGVRGVLQLGGLVAKLGGGRILRDKYASSLEKASGDPSWIDRRTLGRYLRNIDRDLSGFFDTIGAMADSREPESLRENLGRVTCPVRVMTGTAVHDGQLNDEDLDILREGLVDFTRTPVPGAGHFIFEEQPEAVVQEIMALADLVAAIAGGKPAGRDSADANEEEMACVR